MSSSKPVAPALLILLSCAFGCAHAPPPKGPAALAQVGSEIDRDLFDAFNRCDLERFGSLVAPDVEFLHDQSGPTRSRESLVESVRKNICGKVRRELVEGTLQTYPLEGYGAVQLGSHRFCQAAAARCSGSAQFVHVWQREGPRWQLTRVVSYDHRPLP